MQFQVNKTDLHETRFVDVAQSNLAIGDGEVLVKVERFGYSANNITYAAMGERLGYWQFFPPAENQNGKWGVVPVWGFAEVVRSNHNDVPVGDRLFGYFPPASHLVMKPGGIADQHFFDTASHRMELPKGYNMYRRVNAEPGYNKAGDELRMLLYPLYITGFCIWDQLVENNWYEAEQVIIVSASSKTSIGTAYALQADESAPMAVGLTSSGNVEFVEGLGLYDQTTSYDDLEQMIAKRPTTIVDMSGNADLLGRLHKHLGDDMKMTMNVGLSHWDGSRRNDDIIRDRSEVFFAPGRIQQRMKEWGPDEFAKRSTGFIMKSMMSSQNWLKISKVNGLEGLSQVFDEMRDGKTKPEEGLVIEV